MAEQTHYHTNCSQSIYCSHTDSLSGIASCLLEETLMCQSPVTVSVYEPVGQAVDRHRQVQ